MLLIKIGGGASINLPGIARDIKGLEDRIVIVHGANALRDSLARRLGVEKRMLTSVSGISSVYSDEEMIDVMLMAYSGLRNKRLVELLHQNGVNAIGLSGLDGAMVRGTRNKGIRVREGGKTLIKRDLSGKPVAVNRKLLGLLLENDFTPVITAPIIDERNAAINSENDDVVTQLAHALSPDWVIQLIEAPGLLRDPDDPTSVVPTIAPDEVARWEDQKSSRMTRKMKAICRVVRPGVTRVLIADGRTASPIANAMAGHGTVVA
ncbi:MAG: [LysW]-aminoadipate kinase [Gemmatimonadetes bacterium]|nr:[LysW]-aminoadipate kinase [Gemmatimonadota bacterium]MYE17022.1 [LysW]-aminoadipate kinase [Gemmatimonadota bacterium]